MNFAAQIENCISERRNDNLLMETSAKVFRWHLRRFALWLCEEQEERPTPDNIKRYMRHLQRPKADGGRGFMPRSTRVSWVAICFWDTWMREEGYAAVSVMPAYELPHIADAEQPVLSDRDANLLAGAVERIEPPFRRALARAAFWILATTCIRNEELRMLRVSRYDRYKKTLQVVRGKGEKNRPLALEDVCAQALDAWLKVRPKAAHDFLFCWDDTRNRRLGEKGLIRLLREISEAAGFKGNIKSHKPHAMRHGAATRALNNGETLIQVQARLGHSSVRTTEIYLHLDTETMYKTRNATALHPVIAAEGGELRPFAPADDWYIPPQVHTNGHSEAPPARSESTRKAGRTLGPAKTTVRRLRPRE